MHRLILSIAFAIAISNSTVTAASKNLGNVADLHPTKIDRLVALNPQPLPPRW